MPAMVAEKYKIITDQNSPSDPFPLHTPTALETRRDKIAIMVGTNAAAKGSRSDNQFRLIQPERVWGAERSCCFLGSIASVVKSELYGFIIRQSKPDNA